MRPGAVDGQVIPHGLIEETLVYRRGKHGVGKLDCPDRNILQIRDWQSWHRSFQ
jgi:hypothetical protein